MGLFKPHAGERHWPFECKVTGGHPATGVLKEAMATIRNVDEAKAEDMILDIGPDSLKDCLPAQGTIISE